MNQPSLGGSDRHAAREQDALMLIHATDFLKPRKNAFEPRAHRNWLALRHAVILPQSRGVASLRWNWASFRQLDKPPLAANSPIFTIASSCESDYSY